MDFVLILITREGISYTYLDGNPKNRLTRIELNLTRMRLFFGGAVEPFTIHLNKDIWPYKVIKDGNISRIECKSGEFITIVDIIKFGLTQLKSKLIKRNINVSRAVLGAPLFFNAATREEFFKVFASNDVELLEILNTIPTTIENCAEITRGSQKKCILAFDLFTGEATVLLLNNKKAEVIATCDVFEIGPDFELLFNHIVKEFCTSISSDVDNNKDVEFVGVLGKILSSTPKFYFGQVDPFTVDVRDYKESSFKYEMTSTKRDALYKSAAGRIIDTISNLKEDKLPHENITDVIICNMGSTYRLFHDHFLEALKDFFPKGTFHPTCGYEIIMKVANSYLETHEPKTSVRFNASTSDAVIKHEESSEIQIPKTNAPNNAEILSCPVAEIKTEDDDSLNLEVEKLKTEKAEKEKEVEKLKLQLSNLKQNESNVDVNDLRSKLDQLKIEKAEMEDQVKTLKLKLSNNQLSESKITIVGVDLSQKRCKAAFVDQPQTPIWESTSELELNPESLVQIFRELKNATKVESAVVAVCGNIKEAERRDVVFSATMSQISVLRVVNEATAILAAVNCIENQDRCVLILDVNDQRLQTTVFKRQNERFTLLLKTTTDQISEIKFEEALLNYCTDRFFEDTALNLQTLDSNGSKVALQRLKEVCIEAKQRLLYIDPTRIDVGALYFDHDFSIRLSRATCHHIVTRYMDDIPKYIAECLRGIDVQRQAITDVILIGNFAQFLDHFTSENFTRATVHKTEDWDEIVARGAAILAKTAFENPNPKFDQFIEPRLVVIR